VADADLVQALLPPLQLVPVGDAERDMVQADPALAERRRDIRVGELVRADELAAHHPDDVAERSGVLIEHRLSFEQLGVPRDARLEVSHGQGHVGDGRKG
jgi:hypothetical protein